MSIKNAKSTDKSLDDNNLFILTISLFPFFLG